MWTTRTHSKESTRTGLIVRGSLLVNTENSRNSRVWNGRLNELPEMQREEILAQRQEEMQKRLDGQNLTKLLAAQGVGEDSVANAAKRASVEV